MRHARSSDTDDGAAAVEFALILPVFMMLVIGMITGGILLNHKIGLTQAAREGSRFGSTLPNPPAAGQSVTDWLTMVKDATVGSAGDDFTAGADNSSICVAFVHSSDPAKTWHMNVDTTGTASAAISGPCWSDPAPINTDNRVQVDIQRDMTWSIGLATWHPHIDARTVIHYERQAP
jgi:Flp pilus assembly protein TadG